MIITASGGSKYQTEQPNSIGKIPACSSHASHGLSVEYHLCTFLPTYKPTYVPIDLYRIRLSLGQSINPLTWLILFKGHPPEVYTCSTKLQFHRSYDVSSASECLKENRHGVHHVNLELESKFLLVWIPASLRSKSLAHPSFKLLSHPTSPTPHHPQKPTTIYPSSKLLAMPTR